jgi:hypothetical protein
MSLGGETASMKMTREREPKFRRFTRTSLLLFGDARSRAGGAVYIGTALDAAIS